MMRRALRSEINTLTISLAGFRRIAASSLMLLNLIGLYRYVPEGTKLQITFRDGAPQFVLLIPVST